MDSPQLCPKCGAEAVVFDELEGISACEACGHLLEESELVQHLTFMGSEEGPAGVFVGAHDTGQAAGAYLLHGSGTGLAIQRASRHEGKAKLKARLQEVAGQLRLQRAVADQALHFQEQLIPTLMGNWRRDYIVAASLYCAIRLSSLPVTLVDLSGAMHVDMFALGRHYHEALKLLDVRPPAVEPDLLLTRGLDRLATALKHAGRLAEDGSLQGLRPDAALLLRWMAAQTAGLCHPLANVSAAVVLAAEMCSVPGVSVEAAAEALNVGRHAVERKLVQVRRKLMDLSRLLPYSANITARNLGSHARTLIKLSGVLLAAGSTNSAQPAPQQTQQAQQEAVQHQVPSATGGSAAQHSGAEAAPPAEEPRAAPDTQRAQHASRAVAKREAPGSSGSEDLGAKSKQPRVGDGGGGSRGPGTRALKQPGALSAPDPGHSSGGAGVGGSTGASGAEDESEGLGDEAFDDELAQYLRRPDEVAVLQGRLDTAAPSAVRRGRGGPS